MVGSEVGGRFEVCLNEDEGDDCQGDCQVFDALSFHLGTD
jgi:hypothetical protein